MKRKLISAIMFSAIFGLSSTYVHAQTPEQRAKIVSRYDMEALEALRVRLQDEYNANMEKARAMAAEKGWPLVIDTPEYYATLEGVLETGEPLYSGTFNQGSVVTSRTNHLQAGGALGLNLQGANMAVGVWDQNHPRITHNDFGDRLFTLDGSNVAASFHSTHVTGTMVSSGLNNSAGRGYAPLAFCWVNDWSNDLAEQAQQAGFGLLVSNHSYGLIAGQLPLYFFGAYTQLSRTVDEVTFEAPSYLPVYAAGNDRTSWNTLNPSKNQMDLLTARATSKNSVVVANGSQVSVYTGPASVTLSTSSTYGPTDDFRIKPDITNKGMNVLSTSNASVTAYDTASGTSMAAPGVSGVLLLLQEHYSNVNNGDFMLAATAKGLILHTADEAGPSDGPDHMFGWGLINARRAAETISGNTVSSIVEERTLTNGQTYTRDVFSVGNQPLMVSISWTDRPGNINTGTVDQPNPVLVNDLDIRVTRNGQTVLPWGLNKSFSNVVAQRMDNNVDPFEKIEILNPQQGIYTITVSHKGNLVGGSQNYSLIVTGVNETLSSESFELAQQISVYPNPAQDFINIQVPTELEIASIEVMDVNGRVVGMQNSGFNQNTHQMSLSGLTSGLYLVTVRTTSGASVQRKIIKN